MWRINYESIDQFFAFQGRCKLEEFIKEKVSKFPNLFEGVLGCDVILKLDQASNNENKIAEIRVLIPGNDLFAKKQAKSFEEAVDNSVDALKRQIKASKREA
jgi:putative sigma-54 modulation protein